MRKMKLRKELRSVGAGEREADRLSDIAELLGAVKMRGLSPEAKRRLAPSSEAARARRLRLPRLSPAWKLSLGGGFATACLLLIAAQGALPGSFLYPVKRKTEDARALVQPNYTETLLEKREEEVEQLKKQETVAPEVVQEAKETYRQAAEEAANRWQKQGGNKKQDYKPKYDWSQELWQLYRPKEKDSRTKNNLRDASDVLRRR